MTILNSLFYFGFLLRFASLTEAPNWGIHGPYACCFLIFEFRETVWIKCFLYGWIVLSFLYIFSDRVLVPCSDLGLIAMSWYHLLWLMTTEILIIIVLWKRTGIRQTKALMLCFEGSFKSLVNLLEPLGYTMMLSNITKGYLGIASWSSRNLANSAFWREKSSLGMKPRYSWKSNFLLWIGDEVRSIDVLCPSH